MPSTYYICSNKLGENYVPKNSKCKKIQKMTDVFHYKFFGNVSKVEFIGLFLVCMQHDNMIETLLCHG